MIGSYISDDYQFCFEQEELKLLRKKKKLSFDESFVRKGNTADNSWLLMTLVVKIDCGSRTRPPTSDIDIDFKKKVCIVRIKVEDFEDWFIAPTEHILKAGPNWRHASTNIYIKTEKAAGYETFYQTIRNNLLQAKNDHA